MTTAIDGMEAVVRGARCGAEDTLGLEILGDGLSWVRAEDTGGN